MKFRLLIITLLIGATARAQSIDSLLMARMSKMIADSLKANEMVLDTSQFEIVNKVIRVRTASTKTSTSTPPIVVDPLPKAVNLLTFSDQFDNPVWEKANGSTLLADQIIGIDSTKSGDLFSVGTKQWSNLLRRQYTFANQKYTQTVILKRGTCDYIGVRIADAVKGSYDPFVNLSTLAVNNLGIPGLDMSAQQLADGSVKVTLTFTTAAGSSYFDIAVVNSTGNSSAVPKGTEKVYVMAVQLNPGDPLPYVKTTNTAIQ